MEEFAKTLSRIEKEIVDLLNNELEKFCDHGEAESIARLFAVRRMLMVLSRCMDTHPIMKELIEEYGYHEEEVFKQLKKKWKDE